MNKNCTILAPNGERSILFKNLMDKYKDTSKALEAYVVHTEESMLGRFKNLDQNGEPLIEQVGEIDFSSPHLKYSINPEVEVERTYDLLDSLGEGITRTETGYEKDGVPLERVTKRVERHVPPFNREDYINTRLRGEKLPEGVTEEERRAELNEEVDEFSKYADMGTELHKVLENLFVISERENDDFDFRSKATMAQAMEGVDASRFILEEEVDNVEDSRSVNTIYHRLVDTFLTIKVNSPGAKPITEKIVFSSKAKLAGTIDLMMVNPDGSVDIYDYKFSSKDIGTWSNYKTNSIYYQQGYYRAMLEDAGIKVNNNYIVSTTIFSDKKSPKIKGINSSVINTITNSLKPTSEIGSKIYKEIPISNNTGIEGIDSIRNSANLVTEIMEELLGKNYLKKGKQIITDEDVEEFHNSKKRQFNGFWTKTREGNKFISFDPDKKEGLKTEREQKKAVREHLNSLEERKTGLTDQLKDYILNSRKNLNRGTVVKWGFGSKVGDAEIRKNIAPVINKYITEKTYNEKKREVEFAWEILTNDDLEMLGMMMFRNKVTGQTEIVSITNEPLNQKIETTFGSGTIGRAESMLGNFKDGYQEKKYSVKEATIGNAELMKAAFVFLNNMDLLKDNRITTVYAISEDPSSNNYVASVDELIEQVKEIKRADVLKDNEAFNSMVEIAKNYTYQEDALQELKDFHRRVLSSRAKGQLEFKDFTEKVLEAESLIEIREGLEKEFKTLKIEVDIAKRRGTYSEEGDLATEKLILISKALAALENLPFKDEHDLHELGILLITESSMLSDPENIQKNALKSVTGMTKKAINNVSSRFKKYKTEMNKKLDALIKEKHNVFRRSIVGDSINVYDNIMEWEKNEEGSWKRTMRLRDPDNDKVLGPEQTQLSNTEKEYIRAYMDVMEAEREMKLNAVQLQSYEEDPRRKREIPLIKASFVSKMKSDFSVKTLSTAFSHYMDNIFNFDYAFDEDAEYWQTRKGQTEMADSFVWLEGNPEKRQQKLDEAAEGEFELNLEETLDLYMFNNAKVQEFNKVMPYVGAIQSLVNMSDNVWFRDNPLIKKTINKYIEEVIFRVDDKEADEARTKKIVRPMMELASYVRLMLTPALGLTNFLANLWSSLSTNTLGIAKSRLGLKHYGIGMQIVLGNVENIIGEGNIVHQLALEYRMANGEVHRLKDTMSRRQRGILALGSRWAHWLNSAPDYYHRMALFVGEMVKEGTLKVHPVTGRILEGSAHYYVDGNLVYDEKKDLRFSEYFNPKADKESVKYMEQKALYERIHEELSDEPGGLNEDGTLARAYSNNLRDDKYKFANMVFGDYTLENRSEFERRAVGSMFWQFGRWMKAKRDMYWREETDKTSRAAGGNYRPYMFRDNEVITVEEYALLSEEDKNQKISEGWQVGQMFEGRLHEGIIQTLIYMAHKLKKDGLAELMDIDDFRKANIGQLFADVIFMMIAFAVADVVAEIVDPHVGKVVQRTTGDNFMMLSGIIPGEYDRGIGKLPFASTSLIYDMYKDTLDTLYDGDVEAGLEKMLRKFGTYREAMDYMEQYQ